MTLSTGSRSNPALGSYEGFITSLFNFISHFYPSTAQVYCASSHPSPLLFLEPYSSFCSPDKILLRLIHLNSHSAPKSPVHPPPCRMSAHPPYFLQLCLWFYCDLSTRVTTGCLCLLERLWAHWAQGPWLVIAEFPDSDILQEVCVFKKKNSWMSVLCGFLFFSSPLPLSIYPLPWHPCLALHIYFCISKCLFLFLSLSLSLSYTCRHMHMDTYTIICRNFFWASCLMEIGGQVEKKWG